MHTRTGTAHKHVWSHAIRGTHAETALVRCHVVVDTPVAASETYNEYWSICPVAMYPVKLVAYTPFPAGSWDKSSAGIAIYGYTAETKREP